MSGAKEGAVVRTAHAANVASTLVRDFEEEEEMVVVEVVEVVEGVVVVTETGGRAA